MCFKKLGLFLILAISIFSPASLTRAEGEPTVHMTIRAGEIAYSEDVAAPEDSTVLSVLTTADENSTAFEVTDIQHYDGLGDYLKCIEIEGVGEKCDDWQYVIDGEYPGTSVDLTPIDGAGSVYLYFSPKNQISLSADAVDSNDTVTITVQSYDYEEGLWEFEDGANVGVGVPDTSGSFNPPTEIMQGTTDSNGQVAFSNIPVGSYEVGLPDEYGYYFPSKALTVTAAAAESSGGGSSGSNRKSKGEVLGAETVVLKKFDVKKAFEFLISQQKENGSFGEDMYTDWAAMALASGNYQAEVIKLIRYFGESKMENPRLTDYERRAMALMALGLNPYHTGGVNYIGKIIEAFDGAQFGDSIEDNDDIFALLVLLNAGYAPGDEMLSKSTDFILGRQRENGSWDESVDMTGAAIVLLSQMSENVPAQQALTKAKNFLKEAQSNRSDGSWSASASSTAWALEGIKALAEKQEDWKRTDNTPADFLGTVQEADGGIKNENLNSRIWETAYAISAMSEKTWSSTMQKFAKGEGILVVAEKPKLPTPKTKIATPKLNAAPVDNTASVISTAEQTITPETAEATLDPEPEENWFKRLLGNIFGF